MKSYLLYQIITIGLVGTDDLLFPSSDEKLEFAFEDGKGRLHQISIDPKDIPHANLSVILNWLQWTDALKSSLRKISKNGSDREYVYKCMLPDDSGKARADDIPFPERVEESIKLIEEFERDIEIELRKPEKEWNYPVKKDSVVPHDSRKSN